MVLAHYKEIVGSFEIFLYAILKFDFEPFLDAALYSCISAMVIGELFFTRHSDSRTPSLGLFYAYLLPLAARISL